MFFAKFDINDAKYSVKPLYLNIKKHWCLEKKNLETERKWKVLNKKVHRRNDNIGGLTVVLLFNFTHGGVYGSLLRLHQQMDLVH